MYIAFDPQEATFLFKRNIKLESKETLFLKFLQWYAIFIFPKKNKVNDWFISSLACIFFGKYFLYLAK
ncbi:hypothetical protein BGI36_04085 [Snodgrassella communis]|jgi:hypothetical protein|nr:hypothetical protein BGI35_05460 [Snodgrassella communis]PIT22167.1 hypothetical protein BGI36_04085 [Snodgrassella communis]